MDLDNEEIEATKKMNEKTADEMFEEENYIKVVNDEECEAFEDENVFIIFNKKYKELGFTVKDFQRLEKEEIYFNMNEFQAMNKKIEELKWT